jgi:hypothetical protein
MTGMNKQRQQGATCCYRATALVRSTHKSAEPKHKHTYTHARTNTHNPGVHRTELSATYLLLHL